MKIDIKIVLGALLLVGLLSSSTAKPLKIGFVNFEQAIYAEFEAKKVLQELEAKELAIGTDEQKARVEIEKELTEYKASMAKLKEDARAKKEESLNAKITGLQQSFNQRRMMLQQEKETSIRQLEEKNRLLLNNLSENGGYSIVFNAPALVYVSPEMKKSNDLTQGLVDTFNKAYPVKNEKEDSSSKASKKK